MRRKRRNEGDEMWWREGCWMRVRIHEAPVVGINVDGGNLSAFSIVTADHGNRELVIPITLSFIGYISPIDS